ncbi:Small RNA 2'-O-methyltransferase [Halocaridina rubra]|uniref:Small RNA 2'-O-methyltransferase n=1 Tax=Halocaridina rubra TaxID=373956 RepID=A0AAN9AGC4_HALRR
MDIKEETTYTDPNVGVLQLTKHGIKFTPPLYQQRYQRVKGIIEKYGKGTFVKVIDLGCSDFKFFRHLRHITGIQEIVLLDKDETTLKDNIHKLCPLAGDYVMLRSEPLLVKVVSGDATLFDQLMCDTHVVTMIELIEHMYPADVSLLAENVFKRIKPKLVIVTTPNSDFNHFIPDFVPGTFRHWDHKFEWTEEEFRNWCHEIVLNNVDYDVEISGCGLGPNNTYCSQMAIFVCSATDNNETSVVSQNSGAIDSEQISLSTQAYNIRQRKTRILSEVTFPVDSRTEVEKDQHLILHKFHKLVSFLQQGEDNQQPNLDYRDETPDERGDEKSNKKEHCEWVPIPVSGMTTVNNHSTVFRCVHVTRESDIHWNDVSGDYFLFPVVNQKYAIITSAALSAWVNMDLDREIPFSLIRSTVEEECFDCSEDGDSWKGKFTLWNYCDSSSDEVEGHINDDEITTDWPEIDNVNYSWDSWENVVEDEVENDCAWGAGDENPDPDWAF